MEDGVLGAKGLFNASVSVLREIHGAATPEPPGMCLPKAGFHSHPQGPPAGISGSGPQEFAFRPLPLMTQRHMTV